MIDYLESPVGSKAECLKELEAFTSEFPENAWAPIRLSRQLRMAGRADEALQKLDEMSGHPEVTAARRIELSENLFDLGRYQEAQSQLEELKIATSEQAIEQAMAAWQQLSNGKPDANDLLHLATLTALVRAYNDDTTAAHRVFQFVLEVIGRLRRINDVNARIAAVGSNATLEQQIARARELNATVSQGDLATKNVSSLYVARCGHCHGNSGDGLGRAARHLNPVPRAFVTQRTRYVSSFDGATDDDLRHSIRNGMPGTSMPAFNDLSDDQVKELIEQLRAFEAERVRRSVARGAVSLTTNVVRPVAIPIPDVEDTTQLREQGRALFFSAGCQQCHRLDASVSSDITATEKDLIEDEDRKERPRQRSFDGEGRPIAVRNLSDDAFKGGDSLEQIFYRISVGISDTPHPALAANPSSCIAIASYVKGLRRSGPRPQTNYERGLSPSLRQK